MISAFGQKFARHAGITLLMNDLNDGLRTPGAIMLGGGNPAQIPAMINYYQSLCESLLADGQLTSAICNYDGPRGNDDLCETLAAMFRSQLGWDVSADHIALTNGSQSAFFYLFNLFGGRYEDGRKRKILLPLAPEYIGYTDAGIDAHLFVAGKPEIEHLPNGLFKYRIDFSALPIDDDIGAICVSRPTNPTGNVLTDDELQRLDHIARERGIPLLIDSAYGTPFPGIAFTDATPIWNDNTVLCMSLSKLGLPGTRCGIVVARPEIATAIGNMNGIISLAPGSMGPVLLNEMIRRNDLQRLCNDVIQPFYHERATQTLEILRRHLPEELCRVHKPEGAFFLWLWFPDLPIDDLELYNRLKQRGVLMVPGSYFFPGLQQPWDHTRQCLRMNIVPEPAVIERGLKILAEEVKRAYLQP
ncbi:MAG: valine--pyruvate transaminase [Burkholderiales bacterium]|jgi:valine--pyruvate aminotransferase|nr:valine--pyruvate transaminase [Burkholderiales bacterium]